MRSYFRGLAALYELSLIVRGAPHPVPIERIRVAGILFAVAALWALLQNATWVPVSWQHPIWQLASEVLGRPVAGKHQCRPLAHVNCPAAAHNRCERILVSATA